WGIAFFSPELITTAFRNRPLQAKEIVQPEALVVLLKQAGTPEVQHLKQRLSPAVIAQIDSAAGHTAALPDLVTDLNRLISGPSLYDPQSVPAGGLKKSTRNLVALIEKN